MPPDEGVDIDAGSRLPLHTSGSAQLPLLEWIDGRAGAQFSHQTGAYGRAVHAIAEPGQQVICNLLGTALMQGLRQEWLPVVSTACHHMHTRSPCNRTERCWIRPR